MTLGQTDFWNTVLHDVYGPRSGGAIIIVDAEDARKGVGKTVCAVALAEAFATAFDYELSEDDLVISGEAFIERLQDHPGEEQPSVVVWDEAVGGGSGDSRRSMAEENVILGRAWQTLRTKRIIQLVTLPDWNDLDKRMRKLADYRAWCQRKPIGTFKPYQIGTPFDGDGIRTAGLGYGDGAESIRFPNLDAVNDSLYQKVSEMKEELINDGDGFDANSQLVSDDEEAVDPEEAQREEKLQTAIRMSKNDYTQAEIATAVSRTQSWVSQRLREVDL